MEPHYGPGDRDTIGGKKELAGELRCFIQRLADERGRWWWDPSQDSGTWQESQGVVTLAVSMCGVAQPANSPHPWAAPPRRSGSPLWLLSSASG